MARIPKPTMSLDGRNRINITIKMRVSKEELVDALAISHGEFFEDAPVTASGILEAYRTAVVAYGDERYRWEESLKEEGEKIRARYTEIVEAAFPTLD